MDQVAGYPLFSFPYSHVGSSSGDGDFRLGRIFTRRKMLKILGFPADDGEEIVFTNRGTYWIHAMEDPFSIEYIGRL